MRYRDLGSTGIIVSEIGFGTWGIGGTTDGAIGYGPTDDKKSLSALARAFELGVTFFDTSDLYGNGHSEELLGQAFKAVRDKVVIATKAGFVSKEGAQNFFPKHIRKSLEKSLRRLKTGYVDLLQLHGPDTGLLKNNPNIFEALRALQDEGKIKAFGISVRNPDEGIVALRELGLTAIQVNFNMLDQRAVDNGLLRTAELAGAGIIVRTPLCFGFLSGKLAGAKFPVGDHRANWPPEQIKRWTDAPQLFTKLNDGKTRTLAQLALLFPFAWKSVSTVIPGMLSPEEADENVSIADLKPLTKKEISMIRKIYKGNSFFVPKTGGKNGTRN